jgi:hypothetical protein
MQDDLNLSSHERSVFWDIFRNGLLHQALPKIGKTKYWFSHEYSGYPKFIEKEGSKYICIDPWKFTDRVINEYQLNPGLILESDSFPLPLIIPETSV